MEPPVRRKTASFADGLAGFAFGLRLRDGDPSHQDGRTERLL